MVKDSQEAMDALEKAVDKDRYQTETKEEEDEENKHDVDSVEMQTLDKEIKKHADQDKDESIACEINENIENINDSIDENIVDNSNTTDDKSEEEQNAGYKESDCEHDSEEERNAWRLLHPDSDSDYSDSETSMGSMCEKWLLRNQKWKEQG